MKTKERYTYQEIGTTGIDRCEIEVCRAKHTDPKRFKKIKDLAPDPRNIDQRTAW